MATEYLYEAISKYIAPILELSGYNLNCEGKFVHKDDPSNILRFTNPRYGDGMDPTLVPPIITPCVPISDKHYVEIKNDPTLDIFNPFVNKTHMIAVLVKLREPMIPYCVSEELQDKCVGEEDYSLLANYINIYNSMTPDETYIVGYTNTEDPVNTKDLYSYSSKDLFEACFGLAVTVYKELNRKYPPEFNDISKAWKKIQTLINKYNKERVSIKREIKEEKLESFDVNRMELSNHDINNFWEPRLFDFYHDFWWGSGGAVPLCAPNLFNIQEDKKSKYFYLPWEYIMCDQSEYLDSLFDKDSFKPYVEPEDGNNQQKQYTMQPETSLVFDKTTNEAHVEVENVPVVQPVVTVDNNQQTSHSSFKIDTNRVHNNMPMMGNQMGVMNPMMGGMNMGIYTNYRTMNNAETYDVNKMDLTGGDIVNPFRAYM